MNPTRNTQMKFRWWLLHNEAPQENVRAMEELWEDAPSEYTEETIEDLWSVKKALNNRAAHKVRRKATMAAAAILLVLISVTATFFLAQDYFLAPRTGEDFVQITVPEGLIRTITLSDSTHVVINAGSTLIYPRQFSSDTRSVYLTGRAFFSVRKDPRRPFIVKTQHIQVTALGTEFDVSAYTDQGLVSTTLKQGRTRVVVNDTLGVPTKISYEIHPNQQLCYEKKSGKVTIHNLDASRDVSWQSGALIFDDATFQQIIKELQHRFGVTIYCHGLNRLNGRYRAKFRPDEKISDVLQILSRLNGDFSYRIEGKKVLIWAK